MILDNQVNEFAHYNETTNVFMVDTSLLKEVHLGEWEIHIEVKYEDYPPEQKFEAFFMLHVGTNTPDDDAPSPDISDELEEELEVENKRKSKVKIV